MNKPSLKVAVAGLGTVGTGTMQLLQRQAGLLARRCGRPIQVVAVCDRTRDKDRGISMDGIQWWDDPVAMAAQAPVDVVVELIGGSDGVAKEVVKAAFSYSRSVVTANKALLAHHGNELAALAEARGMALGFEAAVAGGIPIIKGLREGLAANQVGEVHGILNGTCNYILTKMSTTGADFGAVLAEAQKLGYAEADPSFDIDGIDAAHKLSILAAVCFGCPVKFVPENVEGIRHISADDIKFADLLGYSIKLLGIARLSGGVLEQRVHPCLVPKASTIAQVNDVFNAVIVDGDFVGRVAMIGRGAGAHPTASAVVSDLIDIARGRRTPAFTVPQAQLAPLAPVGLDQRQGAYYLRLMVVDQVGVLARIAAALSEAGVSIAKFFQDERAPGEKVPVVLTTHETKETALRAALARIAEQDAVVEPPRMIRIEQF